MTPWLETDTYTNFFLGKAIYKVTRITRDSCGIVTEHYPNWMANGKRNSPRNEAKFSSLAYDSRRVWHFHYNTSVLFLCNESLTLFLYKLSLI